MASVIPIIRTETSGGAIRIVDTTGSAHFHLEVGSTLLPDIEMTGRQAVIEGVLMVTRKSCPLTKALLV